MTLKECTPDLQTFSGSQDEINPSSIPAIMVSSAPSNATPLCFSINSRPFNHNHTIASAYFSAVFSGLGLSSNLFALVVLAKTFHHTKSRTRSSFLLFLGGLVFTDFMGLLVTGSIVVSFHITHFNWRQLDPHCHFCNFMGMSMVFYGLCPLLLGAAMAVERFVGINRPFARSTAVSNSRACSTVAMVWVTAGCMSLLPLAGLGSYRLQFPGSWCFLNISSRPLDMTFGLIFSLVGLLSLAVSFLLNTVSVVTLLRVCCGQDSAQRRRDYEVEMMVQLILIMAIASVCWCPLLVFIAQTVLSGSELNVRHLLLWLRFATGNQVLDPWVYILFRRAILKRVAPKMDWSRGSIISLYPTLSTSFRKLTRASLGGTIDRLDHDRPNPPLPVQNATAVSSSI
ncbi:thromboxane A2 receptor-like [Sinocyclocheilus anshuiensis]|uniref:Thromboxane A2 receptor n=2 Tax=Sinocyclocheilus anshuiensis TaxID=1608454 RepID=A0A671RL71_9TELE|nr:PREDICTED: thromboxane A2 receptor-like [Sinocyclocheilus anshuiensis]